MNFVFEQHIFIDLFILFCHIVIKLPLWGLYWIVKDASVVLNRVHLNIKDTFIIFEVYDLKETPMFFFPKENTMAIGFLTIKKTILLSCSTCFDSYVR